MGSSIASVSNMATSITLIPSPSSSNLNPTSTSRCFFPKLKRPHHKFSAFPPNGSLSHSVECSAGDVHKNRSGLGSLFRYDKAIPEEIINKPIGVPVAEKSIGNNPRCVDCEAKGAVLCTTCSGSGLYVDSIMESQGIIVKVRCLGCGGTGNIMCSECGGRGHCG